MSGDSTTSLDSTQAGFMSPGLANISPPPQLYFDVYWRLNYIKPDGAACINMLTDEEGRFLVIRYAPKSVANAAKAAEDILDKACAGWRQYEWLEI